MDLELFSRLVHVSNKLQTCPWLKYSLGYALLMNGVAAAANHHTRASTSKHTISLGMGCYFEAHGDTVLMLMCMCTVPTLVLLAAAAPHRSMLHTPHACWSTLKAAA